MKYFSVYLLTAFFAFSTLSTDAFGKRFGGGSSIGKQRSITPNYSRPAPTATPRPAPTQAATQPAPAGNRWLGPLAGIAAGGFLGYMLGSHGMLSGMGGFGGILMLLILGFGIYMIVRMLRKPKAANNYAYAGANNVEPAAAPSSASPFMQGAQNSQNPHTEPSSTQQTQWPSWLDEAGFLRQAKVSFVRLQTANDRGDIADIRDFTTPEMFAEASLQIQERGGVVQTTEVPQLNVAIADAAQEDEIAIVSVHFTGLISEDKGPVQPFSELWHVQKNLSDPKSVWLIAGIQQL